MAIEPQGKFGQIRGPFANGEDVALIIRQIEGISATPYVELGVTYAEKDAMIYGKERDNTIPSSLKMLINGNEIWMGRTHMYETDGVVPLTSFVFPQGAPASVLVEYRLSLSK